MRTIIGIGLSVSLLGCSGSPTGLDALARELPVPEQPLRVGLSARRVGVLDTVLVTLPTRARAGERLELRVPVAINGCVGSDTTIVTVSQLQATIVPYQQVVVPSPNTACPTVYTLEIRTVLVTFVAKGEARVRIVGRGGSDRGLLVIERRITVE